MFELNNAIVCWKRIYGIVGFAFISLFLRAKIAEN